MKSQTTTLPGRHDHPPQPVSSTRPPDARRVGLLDRAALHLGVALIKWGRRPGKVDSRERGVLAREALRIRLEADRARAEYDSYYLSRLL